MKYNSVKFRGLNDKNGSVVATINDVIHESDYAIVINIGSIDELQFNKEYCLDFVHGNELANFGLTLNGKIMNITAKEDGTFDLIIVKLIDDASGGNKPKFGVIIDRYLR